MSVVTDVDRRRTYLEQIIPADQVPADQVLADQVLAATGAKPSARIILAGAGQIEFLAHLIHLGFTDVDCESVMRGPHARADWADVVVAPGLRDEAALLLVMRRFAGAVHNGGALVVQMDARSAAVGERRVRQILLDAGFDAILRLPDRPFMGTLWCARKCAHAVARAA